MTDPRKKLPLDQDILQLLQERDQRAITLLYEYYSPALYNIILQLVRVETVAEEVLQDAFLKIWEKAEQYDPQKGRLFTWMARICRNLAIDTLRSGQFKRGNKTDTLPDSVYHDENLTQQPEETDPGLRRIVSKMDEQSRKVIDLLFFQDYTQSEASEHLGIPLGTVKSRSRKAIQDLRAILKNEGLVSFLLLSLIETLRRYLGY
ncbi:MAG: RNA polymerase sigma factor [Phaeodactylibacter sp.]|nr:RNA polymerase sigma factor [Phaeodactylibacter sp.]MCB9263870.1 RNA polymerase sigma factor [Lewinellaceae bacterium]MCB9288204.1 RNA polymerase sigma factor [Lewinellaceae bacterium]